MEVWRLTRGKYRDRALDGFGASLTGNRWNRKGTAVAYTSVSLELAVQESMMHLALDQIPTDYVWVSYELPDDAIVRLDPLPPKYDLAPPYEGSVQSVGDEWVKSGSSLALRVPAAVLPNRDNVLINPSHARFKEIRMSGSGAFTWPERLLARLSNPNA